VKMTRAIIVMAALAALLTPPGARIGPGFTATTGAAISIVGVAHAAETRSPEELIDELHETLLAVMKKADELGYSGRYDMLYPVISGTFDLDFMGTKSLGRHWRELDPEQQKDWIKAFGNFTISNYAARFDGYSGQTFEVVGEEAASHETRVVRTKIVDPERDEEETQLNYRLRETDGGWRVIDVYLHGSVSELALRRAEFSTAYERQGFDKVLASLKSKIEDLSSGPGA